MKKYLVATSALALLMSSSASFAAGAHGAHWTYGGDTGPVHWGNLSSEFATCSTGKNQSPINIISADANKGDLKPIEFHYNAMSNPDVVNNGHTIQVNYAPGSYAIMNGTKYNLLQFHFHNPSEEQVDGKYSDMVVHLVHKSDDGGLGVIGVLMNKGGDNEVLKAIASSMPAHEGKKAVMGSIDVNDLLPEDKTYWNFTGSLTTPPCSEGVNWHVMQHPVGISDYQFEAYTKIYSNTNRPIQPLNGRTIVSSN